MDTTSAEVHPSAPYREAPVALEAPRITRSLLTVAALLFSLALSSTVAAIHLIAVSSPQRRASAYAPRRSAPRRTTVELGRALEDLARRHRLSLYLSPGISPGALLAAIPESAVGELRASVRALDAYVSGEGLWVHVEDGVLRVEREVLATELDCAGPLEQCATRLERLASVSLQREGAVEARPVRLRVTRDVPALEATRRALVSAGLQVDVVGRTLFVSAASEVDDRAVRVATGVRAVERQVYALSRRTLDHSIEDPRDAMRHTRIAPVTRGGRVVGVRVFGIRSGDLLARLGLANGDVLRRVNGVDVASPDRCLEVYASLRQVDEVTVEIERGASAITLRYVIV